MEGAMDSFPSWRASIGLAFVRPGASITMDVWKELTWQPRTELGCPCYLLCCDCPPMFDGSELLEPQDGSSPSSPGPYLALTSRLPT